MNWEEVGEAEAQSQTAVEEISTEDLLKLQQAAMTGEENAAV